MTAVNKAVALNKCRQMTGGALYAPVEGDPTMSSNQHRWLAVHDAKIEAVADLVDELQGQPLLIAYEFHHELQRLRVKLGEDTPALCGGMSPKDTAEVVNAWNAGELPVLLVHPAAAGHGLNLQRGGAHVAWFTLSWDLELYEQLIRRIWRQGCAAPRVVAHRFLARDTVDIVVRNVLASKARGQGELFEALKRMVAKNRSFQLVAAKHRATIDGPELG